MLLFAELADKDTKQGHVCLSGYRKQIRHTLIR